MKFLLDHDVPDDLSYLLEELAHEVTLLSFAAGHEPLSARRCFVYWRVRARLDSRTTSTSLDEPVKTITSTLTRSSIERALMSTD